MTTAADIPALLRFLAQSASIPLARAMALIPQLQKANLTTIPAIAAHPLPGLRELLFPDDEKAAKQLHNAAKRAAGGGKSTGKRNRDGSGAVEGAESGGGRGRKRRRNSPSDAELTQAEIEADLELPKLAQPVDEETLRSTALYTNRAPLLLAFAVTLLKYTMPEQPLSSRLSLAQAMVSTGARARAYNLGIEKTKGAEDEGWGKGQPVVKVVGREVKVLRRWGYDIGGDVKDGGASVGAQELGQARLGETDNNTEAVEPSQGEVSAAGRASFTEPPLWGLDLEALKKFNAPPLVSAPSHSTSGLPIHRPESARAYLLKSFATASNDDSLPATTPSSAVKPKKIAEEKERNLGLLLVVLDQLYQSWAGTLSTEQLDKRAWEWYVAVRPAVEEGPQGWGGKNKVRLGQILDLRRKEG